MAVEWVRVGPQSLPLMRKTFIEAWTNGWPQDTWRNVSSAYAEDFH